MCDCPPGDWRLRLWSKRSLQQGFTLIELLVTITILAILAMVAAPSFNEAILSNKLAAFANNFVASSQLARSEAIKRNSPVILCRSSDGTSCAASGGWQQGWIVLHGTTVIQQQQALSTDYLFTGDIYSITFQAIGAGATAANLKLCRANPAPGGQDREIRISATGRASVTTAHSGTCP